MQVNSSIITNNTYSYLIVFSISVFLRLMPEILAWPYPIGYDVINYYLPILNNFDNHWQLISNQFPLYVTLLHTITILSQMDPRIVITSSIVLIFGLFSLVIFSISKKIFHLNNLQSIFLSLFVVFQISVLRTSWDLHKDMLAITITFFCLLFINKNSDLSKKMIAIITSLSTLAVLTDRMIGFLLSISMIVCSFMKRKKTLVVISIFITLIYSSAIIFNFDTISSTIKLEATDDITRQTYNPVNLIVLFSVLNGILLPTGIIGLIKSKNNLFKIPLFISLLGSFSWIVFPNTATFLPDRWIIIFSICLSLFSGYGFITLIENKQIAIFHNKINNNYLVILIPFILMGTLFALNPNNSYFSLYGLLHDYIGQYVPMTMQYNAISLQETKSLLSLIDWVNYNTQKGSVIMGSKHLRGWMEMELKDNRSFQFSDNLTRLVIAEKYDKMYLLTPNLVKPQLNNYSLVLGYNNTDFSLYHLKRFN